MAYGDHCYEGTGMDAALSRVVDALPVLVWTARPNGQIDFVSDYWCDFTGLSVFNWTIQDGPNDAMGILYSDMTISVPEPGSVGLILAGALVSLRRRRGCGAV